MDIQMKKKLIGLCAAGAVAAVYFGGMAYFEGKFQWNTSINGIDVSGYTVEEAENKIAEAMEEYTVTLQERDGEETLTAEQVGYHYVSNNEVQQIKEQQNGWFWIGSLWSSQEYQFEADASFDEELLREAVGELACTDKKNQEAPEDAYIMLKGTSFQIVPETEGTKVRTKRLLRVLKEAISKQETQVSLEDTGCYKKPSVTASDEKLNSCLKELNQMTKTKIIYNFGEEREVLDGSLVGKWLSWDEQGNVTLDMEKVGYYVDYLAAEYDTADRDRTFTTHSGTEIVVSGGTYGWLIDRETETEELAEMIKNGRRITRVPAYAQTAVSRYNSDLGDDYVEVDMANQKLWMYVDGEEILSTDIVSGTYNDTAKRTPTGTYTLKYKKSPAVLRSSKPGDSYESPVTYWMPFNGNIGFHDASWRSVFGGEIYLTSGSHGCINLPTSSAKVIYENIYAGMPVICYY